MASATRIPRWYLIPVRAFIVAFALTLISFAMGLLIGIVSIAVTARLHGVEPDMRMAYRHFGAPIALVIGSIALASLLVTEIRHYRQMKALAGIERASR